MTAQAILQWNTIRAMGATILGPTARVNMDGLNVLALSEAAQHLLVVTRVRDHKTGQLLLAIVRSGLDEKLANTRIVLYEEHREMHVVARPIGMPSMGMAFETIEKIAISGIIWRGSLRASELTVEVLHRCQLPQPIVEVVSIRALI